MRNLKKRKKKRAEEDEVVFHRLAVGHQDKESLCNTRRRPCHKFTFGQKGLDWDLEVIEAALIRWQL